MRIQPSWHLDSSLVIPWAENPTTGCWTSDLQNCLLKNWGCFKPLCLWKFITQQWIINTVLIGVMEHDWKLVGSESSTELHFRQQVLPWNKYTCVVLQPYHIALWHWTMYSISFPHLHIYHSYSHLGLFHRFTERYLINIFIFNIII